MTAPDLSTETLRRLLDEATPGPWAAVSLRIEGPPSGIAIPRVAIADDGAGIVSPYANSHLIALAPALAQEVLRLRATLSAITATDCYSRDECTAMARAALNPEDET